MTERKELLGRPMERKHPPRIDATPEALVQAMFRASPGMGVDTEKVYHCRGCGREVNYPGTLYRDERCARCTETLAR